MQNDPIPFPRQSPEVLAALALAQKTYVSSPVFAQSVATVPMNFGGAMAAMQGVDTSRAFRILSSVLADIERARVHALFDRAYEAEPRVYLTVTFAELSASQEDDHGNT